MNLWFGRSFVGGVRFFADQGASITETADDAVVLRVIAGLVGLLMLLSYLAVQRHAKLPPILPAGLVDALGAAAFAAGTAGLAIAAADQAVHCGGCMPNGSPVERGHRSLRSSKAPAPAMLPSA